MRKYAWLFKDVDKHHLGMVCGLQFSGLISSVSVKDTEKNLQYYPHFNKDLSKQVWDVALVPEVTSK